jgi:hypothetical protein
LPDAAFGDLPRRADRARVKIRAMGSALLTDGIDKQLVEKDLSGPLA